MRKVQRKIGGDNMMKPFAKAAAVIAVIGVGIFGVITFLSRRDA